MLLAKVKYVMNKIFRGIVKGQNNVLFEGAPDKPCGENVRMLT